MGRGLVTPGACAAPHGVVQPGLADARFFPAHVAASMQACVHKRACHQASPTSHDMKPPSVRAMPKPGALLPCSMGSSAPSSNCLAYLNQAARPSKQQGPGTHQILAWIRARRRIT